MSSAKVKMLENPGPWVAAAVAAPDTLDTADDRDRGRLVTIASLDPAQPAIVRALSPEAAVSHKMMQGDFR